MEDIDLLNLLGTVLRRAWIIVLTAALGGLIAYGYTFYMIPPLYKANTLLYVNNSSVTVGSQTVTITAAQLSTAQKLVDTYLVILKSRTVVNEIIQEAELPYSYETTRDMITAGAVRSTEVFRIVVTSTSPEEAERIANVIAQVLPDKIADIMAGSDVRIVDYAVIPANRSSPSYSRNALMGALIGAGLSVLVLTILYLMDDVIHTEEFLSLTYPDIPLLCVIPDMNPEKRQRHGYYGFRYYRRAYAQDGYGYRKKT